MLILIGLVSTIHIVYQSSDDQILSLYRQLGLKTGDAMIAAFCEQEAIDVLISENRHFLHELPKKLFTKRCPVCQSSHNHVVHTYDFTVGTDVFRMT